MPERICGGLAGATTAIVARSGSAGGLIRDMARDPIRRRRAANRAARSAAERLERAEQLPGGAESDVRRQQRGPECELSELRHAPRVARQAEPRVKSS